MTKSLIILNSPAGSGKDTVGDLLVNNLGYTKLEYKTALYKMTTELYGLDYDSFMSVHLDRDKKDSVIFHNGMTTRQLLIEASETVFKPRYGKTYLGVFILPEVNKYDKVVITDGGFIDEMKHTIVNSKFNQNEVLIMKLLRDECNWEGDSRGDVIIPSVKYIYVDNNHTVECLNNRLIELNELGLIK
jgi:hypothetical protein